VLQAALWPHGSDGLTFDRSCRSRREFVVGVRGRPCPRHGSVQNVSHFRLAERHPALAHAVIAPLICWSFSNSMFRYFLVDHAVPAMWRSLAAARLSAATSMGVAQPNSLSELKTSLTEKNQTPSLSPASDSSVMAAEA